MKTYATAKIHGLTVTHRELHYEGSITIPENILHWAAIGHLEFVHINGYLSGQHWETYVIPGPPGQVQLNGPPANLFEAGEELVVVRYELLEEPPMGIRVVQATEENEIKSSVNKARETA